MKKSIRSCGAVSDSGICTGDAKSQDLQKNVGGSLSVRNEVLFLSNFGTDQLENKGAGLWKALLSEEKPEELLDRPKYLDRTEREGMITREFLVALRTDLTQVVYAWLLEREIKACAVCRCGYGKSASEFSYEEKRWNIPGYWFGKQCSTDSTSTNQIQLQPGMRLY